ncbi:MAG: UvrD-helicase domain-containing protein [Hungatella sp.]|jgi:DNA helicase-2/ATP-dependent DNA helicase PcrA|nr:UvrD-helicase domain-containing protein [Hungatella sp.]
MANGDINNIYLVNAPAGSGKTTTIKSMLNEISISNPEDYILCITYTNRAAEELQKDMESDKIRFGTIHAYINSLIYNQEIEKRMTNQSNDENIKNSNQRYIEEFVVLDKDTLKKNITRLKYNETSFNSLYYGGLCHDDLLSFAKKVIDRFPIVRKKIVGKFGFIFIDEYQDTSSQILKLFYEAVRGTSVKMYLLGDRMQQIYRNYDGTFEVELKQMNNSIALNTNYRSVKSVVNILNNIYNDPSFEQRVSGINEEVNPDYWPEVLITNSMHKTVNQKLQERSDYLVLYLLNKDKYKEVGAPSLYRAYSGMEKYAIYKKYHSNDVLSNDEQGNPDPLMRFLFSFHSIMILYKNKQFGSILTQCKQYKEFYLAEIYTIFRHEDKIKVLKVFSELEKLYFAEETHTTIEELLDILVEKALVKREFVQSIHEENDYFNALQVEFVEMRNLADYLSNPQISTQHGVKGESHDSVIFVSSDSMNTPIVHMNNFFKIWSQIDFSLNDIEEFYYGYLKIIIETEADLGIRIKDLNADTHNRNDKNKMILKLASNKILDQFADNKVFQLLCKAEYETYLDNPNVGNIKKCFKESTVYGILSAYKIFYVGCSRARKNLSIIVDENQIKAFYEPFSNKMKRIGFQVNLINEEI